MYGGVIPLKMKSVTVFLFSVIIFAFFLYCPANANEYNPPSLDAEKISGNHEVKIRLVNHSGWLLKSIWICPSSNSNWIESDAVKTYGGRKATIRNGQYLDIYPAYKNRNEIRYWNIRINYGKNGQKEFYDVDLFDFSRMEVGRNFSVNFQR